MENQVTGNKSKKLWLLLGVIVLVALIIIIFIFQDKEVINSSAVNPDNDIAANGEEANLRTETVALQEAVAVVPGANPVSKENKVLTSSGAETKTNVGGESALAPQQTSAVAKESLPESVIQIKASVDGGFSPDSFTVQAGVPVTISITNQESSRSVTLGFVDPILSAVMLGAGPGETRAITFQAPAAGEYVFIDGIPGHPGTGRMIVK